MRLEKRKIVLVSNRLRERLCFAQVPDVDAVVVPVGGGGLLAGIAKAMKTMKPSVKIIVSLGELQQKNTRQFWQ